MYAREREDPKALQLIMDPYGEVAGPESCRTPENRMIKTGVFLT